MGWALLEMSRAVQLLKNFPVHYRVHKSLPLVSILSQIDPVLTTSSYLRSILIFSTHLRLGLLSCLFPSGFSTNILYVFSFFPFVLHAPPISSSLTWSNYTRRRVQIMGFLIMQFSPTFHHFISLRYKYSPQHPFLKHPQSLFLP
jgi:hypothetical protein